MFGRGADQIMLDIGANWSGAGAVKMAVRELGNLEKAIERIQKAEAAAAKKGEPVGGKAWRNGQAGFGNSKIAAAFGTSPQVLQAATAFGAAGVAIGVTTKALIEFNQIAEEGANLRQLQQSFDMFIESVDRSPAVLSAMVEATNGTMSRFAAMENMLTLVAGASRETGQAFADAAPQLAEIAKAANKLNPTLGDTNFMFQSLARGVKRSETRLLDNLGLNIKVAAANTTFARAVGKSVMELTAEEKQIALLNETLRVGQNLIEQVGGETAAFGDAWINARSAVSDFRSEWKMAVSEFAEAIGLQSAIQGFAGAIENASAGMRASRKLAELQRENPNLLSGDDWRYLNDAALNGATSKAAEAEIDRLIAENEAMQRARAQQKERERIDTALRAGMPAYAMQEAAPERVARELDPGAIRESASALKEIERNAESATEAMRKANAAGAAVLSDMIQGFATQRDELKAGIAEVQAKLGGYFSEAKSAEEETSLFGVAIKDLGEYSYRTNPLLEDQVVQLEDMQAAYDKARDTLKDYELGIKGIGQSEKARNSALEKNAEIMAVLGPQIEALAGIQAEYATGVRETVFDQDMLIAGLEEAMNAQGRSAPFMARYAILTGQLSEGQADAALKAALMQDAFDRIARDAPTAKDALEMLADVTERFENLDLTPMFQEKGDIVKAAFADAGIPDDPLAFENGQEGAMALAYGRETARAGIAAKESLEEEFFGPVQELLDEEREITVMADVQPALDEIGLIEARLAGLNGTFIPDIAIRVSDPYSRKIDVPGNADGGTYYGGPMIVGERGPELLWPRGGGTVTPNHHLVGGGGGGGDTFIFNNREAAAIAMSRLSIARRSKLDRRMGMA